VSCDNFLAAANLAIEFKEINEVFMSFYRVPPVCRPVTPVNALVNAPVNPPFKAPVNAPVNCQSILIQGSATRAVKLFVFAKSKASRVECAFKFGSNSSS
jgi:hypothetical protein